MSAPVDAARLRGLAEKAAAVHASPWTVSAWDNRAPLDLGPTEPTPFGISSGCVAKNQVGHDCADEDSGCVVVEFARVHLNDAGKSPNHPDNLREWELAKHIAASDPVAVIALLDALKIAREALDECNTMLQHLGATAGLRGNEVALAMKVPDTIARMDALVKAEP